MLKLNIPQFIFSFTFTFFCLSVMLFAQDEVITLPVQRLSFSLEGGANIAYTDFKKEEYGPSVRGGLQYFFYPHSKHRLGLGINYSFQQIKGKDYRGFIFTSSGIRELPTSFSTNIFSPGIFTEYSYLITDRFSANVKVGLTYNVFNPKDNKGQDAAGYREGLYNKEFITLIPEGGLKYRVTDNIDISVAMNYSLPSTDYLDDFAAPNYKDSFFNFFFGLSYSFSDPAIASSRNKVERNINLEPYRNRESDKGKFTTKIHIPINENAREIYLSADAAFIPGTARFKSEIYSELDMIMEIINADTLSRWRIEAHTDDLLEPAEAIQLSLERAKAVNDYFIILGVKPNRLRFYGLGGTFPLTNNSNEEGRHLNRRLMIIKELIAPPVVVINDDSESDDKEIISTDAVEETFTQFILRGDDSFEGKTDKLNAIAKFLLDEIVFYIQEQPDSRWKIEGYMDNDGSEAFLKQLSLDRAKAVYNYLISSGISADQLSYEGYGSSSPITSNESVEGRSINRRVIIIRSN